VKKLFSIAFATAACALGTSAAHAGDVYWSIGISAPPVATVISNAPNYGPPAYGPAYGYYAEPVYAPPPRVVYRPAPVVVVPAYRYYQPAPVVVYGGHHRHWKHGYDRRRDGWRDNDGWRGRDGWREGRRGDWRDGNDHWSQRDERRYPHR